MNKTEEVLIYVVFVLFVGVLLLTSIISFDLVETFFQPQSMREEVIFYIPTVLLCFAIVILILNSIIYVLSRFFTKDKEKDS